MSKEPQTGRLVTPTEREKLTKILDQLDDLLLSIEKRAIKDGIKIDCGDCPVYDAVNSAIGGCIEAIEQDNLFLEKNLL